MKRYLYLLIIFFIAQEASGQITPPGPITLCQGGNVVLKAPTGTAYQWYNNNTLLAGAISQNYMASISGNYKVAFTAAGVRDTTAGVDVTVNPSPVAGFTFSPNNQCSTVPVQFIDASTGMGLTYQWSFNDYSGVDSVSSLQNPLHRFVLANGGGTQTFQVKLTVTNNFGCSNTSVKPVTINQPGSQLSGTGLVNYNGSAYFTNCSFGSSTFTFVNQSTSQNTNYFISWGNGAPDYNSGAFTTTTQIYTTGNYTLQYIVTGQNGCKDTGIYHVFVGSNPAVGLGNPGGTTICTGDSLTFPITGAGNNPSTTIYAITFNDGTQSIIQSHPPPLSITHVFSKASCGTSSSNYTNSFLAKIVASNPCQTSTGAVEPIYVSQKPVASFNVSPKDTVCVNTTITFDNTSINNLVTNGSCSAGKIVWDVSPSTGWSISCGMPGKDLGLTDPSLWNSGTNTFCINFSVPGTYKITLKTGNSLCGVHSITKTICVNPFPTAAFAVDTTVGCAPLKINTTTTTNAPNCGQYTYKWTTTYLSTLGCVPTGSSVTYLQNTADTSREPVFQFNNPGVYTVGLVVIGAASACSTTVIQRQITVKGKPNITSLGISSTICQGLSINPNPLLGCYINVDTAYLWSFGGGLPASSTIKNPGSVLYNASGSFPVSLKATNSCGDTTLTQQLTVNPIPDLTVPADTSYCAGSATGPFVFLSTLSATTITWTNSNTAIGLGSNGSGNIASFNATNTTQLPITATIRVTASKNGCIKQATFIITVNPKPATPTVTTPVDYCVGDSSVTLSASFATGNTLLWYTTSAGGVGDIVAPKPFTTAAGTTTWYVSQVNSSGCESNRAAIAVIVKAVPAISSSSSTNPVTCSSQTGTITLNGLTPSTSYTVRYSKNGGTPVSATLSSNGAGVLTIPNLGAGNYTNVTVVLNGCPSVAVGPFTLSDPNPPPPPVAESNSPICSGKNLSLTAKTTSTGTITFSWSGPGFSSAVQNPAINNATVAASGKYYVTNTVNNCTSLPDSVSVVVNATPATPTVTSNSPVCEGDSLKLTSGTSAIAVTYSWTGPNGFTSTVQNPFVSAATIAASGNYTLITTPLAANCPSSPATVNVLVRPVPAITGTFTNPLNCGSATGTITLIGLTPSTTYTVRYSKNGGTPVSVTASSNASGVLSLSNLSSGNYSNISVALNGCPSNIVGPFTLSDPNPPAPPVAGSNSPICSGKSLNLTASTTSTGTITYSWSGPAFSSTQQNPVINNVTTTASGKYYVTNTVNNCTSLPDSVNVIVNATPATPTVTSNSPVCEGDSLKLTSGTSATAVTYSWTGPNSFTSTLSNPTLLNSAAGMSGIYTLVITPTAANCPSSPATVNVVVRPVPVISGTFTNPLNCGSATGTITLTGLAPNTAYTIQYLKNGTPVSVSVSSNVSGSVTLNGLVSGIYSAIKAVLNNCTSNAAGPFTLSDPNPPAAPKAGSNNPGCSGDTLRLTAVSAITGATYFWIGPNPFTSNLQNPVINTVSPAINGRYYVTVTLNNCTSLRDSVDVFITPKPATPTVSANSPVCSGDTIKLTASNAPPGIFTYEWTGPNGYASGLQNPAIPNAGANQAGTYTVTAVQASCRSVIPASIAVEVRQKPAITASSSTNPTSCGSFTGTITLQGLLASTAYTLQYVYNGGTPAGIPVVSNPTGAIVLNNLPSGVYSNVSVALNGCTSPSVGPFILTDLPPLTPSAGSNGPLCVGSTLSLTSSVALTGNVVYSWFGPGGYSSSQQNPVIAVTSIINNGTYTVTASLNGCSASASINVMVSPKTVGGFTSPDSTVCMGTNIGTIQLMGYTGSVGRWQSSVNNGITWNTIANTTPSLTYNGLTTSTWFRAIVENGACPPAFSDTTKITVVNSVDKSNAGPDQKLCNQQSLNLSANNPVIGKGAWTQTFGPAAVIANPIAPNTSVTSLQPDKIYRFLWTITGATGCGSSADEVEIINRPAITPANAGIDLAICDFTTTRSVILRANADASRPYEKGLWTILNQPALGNGLFSNPSDPASSFTFSQPGTYLLIWTISNDVPLGCPPSKDTIAINISNRPAAGFSVTPRQLCAGQSISVSNTSTSANVYQWYWGDGDSASFVNGTHTYTAAGSFTITLIAKKLDLTALCTDTARQTVTVAIKIPAQISIAPGKTCVPYNLQVSAVNASNAGLIEWKIFDAAVPPGIFYANGNATSHVYNFAGNDSVRLIVHSANGCTDSTTYRFSVFNIPVITFSPLTATTCSHDTTIVFTGITTYSGTDPVNYKWFIDGQVKGNTNPFSYRFLTSVNSPAAVQYNLRALAQNTGGCGDTSVSGKIIIQPLPPVSIKVSPALVQQQPDYRFTFQDTTTATDSFRLYQWNMGDRSLQTRNGRVITYEYSDTGTFKVKLLKTDLTSGCRVTDSVRVIVLPVPGYLQVPNAICPGCYDNALRTFLPLGKGLKEYHLRIYTTWGELIFETSQLNSDGSPAAAWNGKWTNKDGTEGKLMQQNAYTWQIEARYINGTEWRGMLYPGSSTPVKAGFITLVK